MLLYIIAHWETSSLNVHDRERHNMQRPLTPIILFLPAYTSPSWVELCRCQGNRVSRGGLRQRVGQIKANTLVSLWDAVMTSGAAETCRGCVESALITLLLSPLLHFADSSLKWDACRSVCVCVLLSSQGGMCPFPLPHGTSLSFHPSPSRPPSPLTNS